MKLFELQVQVRACLRDERSSRRGRSTRPQRRRIRADRAADRGRRERAVDPARPQSRTDPARQADRRRSRCRRSRRACLRSCSSAGPTSLQAEQQLIAANAQIGAAKALYFPTISLTGLFGGASTDLSNLFKGRRERGTIAGSIAGPIFTGGGDLRAGRTGTRRRRRPRCSTTATIQNAFADVDNALVARETLAEQLAAQAKLVNALRGYSRLAQALFDGGRTPYSTVLQAEQQLFPAELDWASARAQLCVSLVGIYKAMGGGWVTTAERLTMPADGGIAAR